MPQMAPMNWLLLFLLGTFFTLISAQTLSLSK